MLRLILLPLFPVRVDIPYMVQYLIPVSFFKAEGELYTWGLNSSSGRLGLGHMEHAFTPQRVPLEKKVLELALGTYHVLAICEE